MTGYIIGTGAYAPSLAIDNHEIEKLVETSDEWIRERTGVVRRHIVGTETTVSMAIEAGRRAVEDAGIAPEEIDLILVSTISPNAILPCVACRVQEALGAVNAACYDLSAACTGFILAYSTVLAYMAGGMIKTALIVASDSLSNLTNWEDRGTCILFGDGAGAAVVRAGDGPFYLPVTHADGSLGDSLTCRSRQDHHQVFGGSLAETYDDASYYIEMDGKAIFQFAVRKVPEVIRETLQKNNVRQEEIDWFVLHQANGRIIESVAKRLGEPLEKFPMNVQEYGNTSSSSIPLLLDEMKKKGMLQPGQKLMLAGFGAGLLWGAAILEWK